MEVDPYLLRSVRGLAAVVVGQALLPLNSSLGPSCFYSCMCFFLSGRGFHGVFWNSCLALRVVLLAHA